MNRKLRLAVQQFAPRLGDPEANASRIAAASGTAGAGLLLTPELSLTGYDVGDTAPHLARRLGPGTAADLAGAAFECPVLLGAIDLDDDGVVYNAAVLVEDGRCTFRHRKIYLPTYGMFDEGRFFGRGRNVATHRFGEWRMGVLVCEDFWHPALPYLLAAAGMDLLLVQVAAAGRGVTEAGGDARFASSQVWARMARTCAQLYGVYVALANRVGVEGGLTFGGGSLIVGPDGTVLASADDRSEELLIADLDLDAVVRARRPYAHSRDEDLRLVHAHLGALIAAAE